MSGADGWRLMVKKQKQKTKKAKPQTFQSGKEIAHLSKAVCDVKQDFFGTFWS